MKIVIDINEADYHRFVAGFANEDDATEIQKIFKNGTPLPKGHGRLIDADKLDVGYVHDRDGSLSGYRYLTKYDIDNAPTIIEADEESEDKE